jgi:predicted XRE-type DNA-binding protein
MKQQFVNKDTNYMKQENDFLVSSGNPYADVGLSNPEERLAKAELAIKINDIIKRKKLDQTEAAKLLDVDQPKISALNKGNLKDFSIERLFKFLTLLGQKIEINVTPKLRAKRSLIVNESKPKKIITNIRVQKPTTKEIFAKKR